MAQLILRCAMELNEALPACGAGWRCRLLRPAGLREGVLQTGPRPVSGGESASAIRRCGKQRDGKARCAR